MSKETEQVNIFVNKSFRENHKGEVPLERVAIHGMCDKDNFEVDYTIALFPTADHKLVFYADSEGLNSHMDLLQLFFHIDASASEVEPGWEHTFSLEYQGCLKNDMPVAVVSFGKNIVTDADCIILSKTLNFDQSYAVDVMKKALKTHIGNHSAYN